MSHAVKCPLCDANMPLTELASNPNGREDRSYVWVCDVCPGVLLEWWDDNDTQAVSKYLKNHEGVIKVWDTEDNIEQEK